MDETHVGTEAQKAGIWGLDEVAAGGVPDLAYPTWRYDKRYTREGSNPLPPHLVGMQRSLYKRAERAFESGEELEVAEKEGRGHMKAVQRWHEQVRVGRPPRAVRRRMRKKSLLEHNGNGVHSSPGRSVIKVMGCRCKRHACPRCRLVIGLRAKSMIADRLKELQQEHEHLGDVQMWTLTVDPNRYADAESALDDVKKQRRISRAMKAVGAEYWVCALEWHVSGWPHWHVMVWQPQTRAFVSHRDLTAEWAIGHVQYEGSKGREPAKAAKYVTKYLTDAAKSALPDWMLDRSHVVMIRGSKAWGAVLTRNMSADNEHEEAEDGLDRAEAKSTREALKLCCTRVAIIREWVTDAGVVLVERLGEVDLPARTLKAWLERQDTSEVVRQRATGLEVYETGGLWPKLKRLLDVVECDGQPKGAELPEG